MGGVVVVAFFDGRYTLRQAIFQEWLDGRLARGMRTSRCAWPPPIAGGSSPPFWVVFLRREGKFRKISIKRDSPLGNLHFFFAVVCLNLMIKLSPRHMTLFWGLF